MGDAGTAVFLRIQCAEFLFKRYNSWFRPKDIFQPVAQHIQLRRCNQLLGLHKKSPGIAGVQCNIQIFQMVGSHSGTTQYGCRFFSLFGMDRISHHFLTLQGALFCVNSVDTASFLRFSAAGFLCTSDFGAGSVYPSHAPPARAQRYRLAMVAYGV